MADEANLIDPSGIPQFLGDLSTLGVDVMLLYANAGQFRASGADLHTAFQGLSAFYRAPEAHDLFSSTQPVKAKSDAFADDLEKVAGALDEYGVEVRPLVEKLATLKADARAFVASVAGDDDWRKDKDKVDTNNGLWRDVNHTVAAFQAAELACHNKITALVGGTTLTVDDGSHGENMYGYRAEDLDHAGETPWGSAVEQEYEGWDWVTHTSGQVWDGFWTDGVMGTVHGVGTLFGADGSEAAGEAWTGLAKLGTASFLTSATLGTWWLVPDDKLPSWLRDSRTTYKQTVKGFVAWDTWESNPARAAGTVSFNVLGLLGTEGAGAAATGAGRTGAAARAVSAVGKVGRAVDPFTYVGKAGKFAYVKVGDAFTALKNLDTGAQLDLAGNGGRYTLPDQPTPFAERAASVPEHAVEYVDQAGKRVYLDTRTGDVLNANGTVRQYADEATHELSANDRTGLDEPAHADRPREPAGVGARAEHTTDAARAGEQAPGRTGRTDGGHAAARDGDSGRHSGGGAAERPGTGGGTGGRGGAGAGASHGDGAHGSGHDHGSAERESADQQKSDDSPESGEGPDQTHRPDDPPDGEPDLTRPELLPGRAERTLREMQRMRHGRARYKGAEDFVRQMVGGAAERHYRVSPNDHPYHPVQTPGGRNVDVPVDMPGGRTLAVEVKHYLEWRTITLKDGSTKPVKGEVPLSNGIIEQINKDLALRRQDPAFDPRWVFTHAPPSQALRNYLIQARIIFVEYGPPPK
ncbi:hypothetical protein [Streptomyces caniscabiei]|uniref:hypothetical protein n=1 Tax=Streptomyces caniscabiei TaxID=2746961 RepID=UPI001872EFDA|nr:hypothetical protein [Streptomyces caniscabiei]MBE4771205.1 hypothetical protein [Streptomyces caniscabiei]MDX2952065.1 hypothetical protein [Streptomyces caniscabiei]